jgi:hypothetical protein
LLHPAAGHGVRQVSGHPYGFWPPADLVGPLFDARSHWQVPFEALPSPAAVQLVTAYPFRRRSPSCEGSAFTEWRALPSLEHRSPVRVATDSSIGSSTSGPSSTGESVAGAERFRPVRPDAPMGFGSTRSDACRAPLLGAGADPFGSFHRGGSKPHRRPSPSENGEVGKVSACLAPQGSMLVPTRRSAARRSSSLAARRLLRFRSARFAPKGGPGSVALASVVPKADLSRARSEPRRTRP